MNPTVTPDEASQALAQQSSIRAHVAAGTARYSAFLVGLAAASSMFVLGVGMLPLSDVAHMLVLVAGLLGWILLLTVSLIPGARVYSRGFNNRWGLAMGGWGAAFGIAIGLGLGLDLPEPWFWVMAPVVAAPALIGAWLELRGPRG
ncbi:MAG TPA: hypothetical protein PK781_00205 [Terrimesophilobacter sp.]|nr:hypothetical protein [Terrimesophilobacter sp.]HRP98864.1 hypothetical protein [Terrimesophilobacter sp.]